MAAAITYSGSASHASATPSILLRFFPSLTDFAFLLPIWLLFSVSEGTRTLLSDGDTGWHIRTGDWIIQHGQVPYRDIFSFTKVGQPWFAWEWGWDVLASLIHTRLGLPGIVLVNTILLGFISSLLFGVVKRRTTNHLLALATSSAAIIGTSFHWLARPHLLSWLFVLVFLDVIDRYEYQARDLLWCLPLLTLLWVNLHGSFFIGISFLFIYAFAGGAQKLILNTGHDLQKSRKYLIHGLLCLMVSFVNPYGWHLHQHLIAYLSDFNQLNNISEFKSPDFHCSIARFYELFIIIGSCVAVWSIRQGKWPQAALLLLWAHLSLCVVRNLPIYLFLAAPALASVLDSLLYRTDDRAFAEWFRRIVNRAKTFGNDMVPFERVNRFHLISFAGIVIVALTVGIDNQDKIHSTDFDRRDFPVAAATVLANHTNTRIFTHDQWGDYLIYKYSPGIRVFVDGRSDLYGAEFSQRWVKALRAEYGWRSELSRFGIDTVLLRVKDPLTSVLKQTHEWTPVFDDGVAIIFRLNENRTSIGAPTRRKNL